MKFSAVAVAALVAGASAHYNETVYTTEVVTAYTTYCPSATTITHGTKTYTVTEATTLTITDCPCTVTKPVFSSSTPAPSLPPVASTPGPYPNATTPIIPPVASTPSAAPPAGSASSPIVSSPPIATGAAAKAFAASGAGLAGAFGVLAYLL